MQVEVKNISGSAVKTIDLPDSIFDVPMNEHVLHHVIKAYRANERQGNHATKTRSLVSGGGKKPFRQKGTGNARQGSSRSPVNVGGATAHGPQPRDYRLKINHKIKKLALRIALSDRARSQKLVVIDDFAISKYGTKQIADALKSLGSLNALLLDERKDDFLYKSTKNIQGASAKSPFELNIRDILGHESLIISENGLNALNQRLEGKSDASV